MKPSIVKSANGPATNSRVSTSRLRASSSPARPAAEPRTGVVRKVDAPAYSAQPAPPRPSGVRSTHGWRCLDPRAAQRPSEERPSGVSIAQLSTQGERLRQSGPEAWLPDATEFVHRAALLVAQGLGFERCRSVCLRGASSVLSVAEAGPSAVVGVAGPVRQLSSVLRLRGLK